MNGEPWVSPFAPAKLGNWPDNFIKRCWIGPFDLTKGGGPHSVHPEETELREDDETRKIRQYAMMQQEEDDHAGARLSLAKVIEKYTADYKNTPRFANLGRDRYALEHMIRVSIGGILNSYLLEHPTHSPTLVFDGRSNPNTHLEMTYDNLLDFDVPTELDVARVILHYVSTIQYDADYKWLRTAFGKALSHAEPLLGSDHDNTIYFRKGFADHIEMCHQRVYMIHFSTFRGYSHWGRDTGSPPSEPWEWKSMVQSLHQKNLTMLEAKYGSADERTMESVLHLGQYCKRVKDCARAKEVYAHYLKLAQRQRGEEDDVTLKLMTHLSNLLLDEGDSQEAGIVVHDYFSQQYTASSRDHLDISAWDPSGPQVVWKDICNLKRRLESHKTPKYFVWADHRLFTCTIGQIDFLATYPPDHMKEHVWTYAGEGGSAVEIVQGSDREVRLRVPYIPYTHFMDTSAFEQGMPYLEYVKTAETVVKKSFFYQQSEPSRDTPLRFEGFGGYSYPTPIDFRDETGMELDLTNCDTEARVVDGFLNNIPVSVLNSSKMYPGLQVDLISSMWQDWRTFAVHKLSEAESQIEIADGIKVYCHGYISGTWTDFAVKSQRTIDRLFVVDLVFNSGTQDEPLLFALSLDATSPRKHRQLTVVERRAFCARLSPSFYLPSFPELVSTFASIYKRRMRGSTVETKIQELEQQEEMNRREKWDRAFEGRIPMNDDDKQVLKRELAEEDERRITWDDNMIKRKDDLSKQNSIDTGSTSTGNTTLATASTNMTDGPKIRLKQSLWSKLKRNRVPRVD